MLVLDCAVDFDVSDTRNLKLFNFKSGGANLTTAPPHTKFEIFFISIVCATLVLDSAVVFNISATPNPKLFNFQILKSITIFPPVDTIWHQHIILYRYNIL
jgi:hypothetical protein